jgi:hypothetical protein
MAETIDFCSIAVEGHRYLAIWRILFIGLLHELLQGERLGRRCVADRRADAVRERVSRILVKPTVLRALPPLADAEVLE